jgi:hypothetical protein
VDEVTGEAKNTLSEDSFLREKIDDQALVSYTKCLLQCTPDLLRFRGPIWIVHDVSKIDIAHAELRNNVTDDFKCTSLLEVIQY